MFDIGFWELALIGIVTLLVVGPDRLPEVARSVGRWVLKTRRFVAGVKSDFNRELQTGDLHKILGDQKEQINELRSMVASTRQELETSTKEVVSATKTKIQSLEDLAQGGNTNLNDPSPADTQSGDTPKASEIIAPQSGSQDKTDSTPVSANTDRKSTQAAASGSHPPATGSTSQEGGGSSLD